VKMVFNTDDGQRYEVSSKEGEMFANSHGKRVEIECVLSSIEMKTADGRISRKINVIRDIKLLREK
jgi:hypothetical protein